MEGRRREVSLSSSSSAFPLEERRRLIQDHDTEGEEEEEEEEVHQSTAAATAHTLRGRLIDWAEKEGKPSLILISRIVWMVVLSGLAASIQFWIPSIYAPNSARLGINLTVLVFNLVGCFIISICTAFKQVKFQYMQSYLMYDGLRTGFCSTFTTFGNLIEDTGRLILSGMWWLSLINLFSTFILSFYVWELGRLVARRWKGGVAYSQIEQALENVDQRMEYEVEKSLLSQGSTTPQSKIFFSGSSKPLYKISHHIKKQQMKSKRHLHRWWPLRRHYLILTLISLPPIANYIIDSMIQVMDYSSRAALLFDWVCMHFLSVAGVCVGLAVDSFSTSTRQSVQWGTFKNNIVSCILIGAAHSLLLFRHYLPFGNSYYFSTLTSRFITSFCGSESSFAGLVDETAVLFNARIDRWIWVRNIGYNLFLCTLIFLVVIFAVRFSVFFHYFGPETAKLYICGVFNQC